MEFVSIVCLRLQFMIISNKHILPATTAVQLPPVPRCVNALTPLTNLRSQFDGCFPEKLK